MEESDSGVIFFSRNRQDKATGRQDDLKNRQDDTTSRQDDIESTHRVIFDPDTAPHCASG